MPRNVVFVEEEILLGRLWLSDEVEAEVKSSQVKAGCTPHTIHTQPYRLTRSILPPTTNNTHRSASTVVALRPGW